MITVDNSILFVFDSFHLDVVPDQLVHVRDYGGVLNVHQHKRGYHRVHGQGIEGARSRPGIDVEFILLFIRLELVRVSRDQDVHVQLPLDEGQGFRVAPRHHLVAVQEADAKLSHGHHLDGRIEST